MCRSYYIFIAYVDGLKSIPDTINAVCVSFTWCVRACGSYHRRTTKHYP
ncbi:TPA: EAST1 family heat-stable enterotoxin [Klebsiella aerogenes]|nr:EAST1 family heat-stable enterotoxin [Citrobacter werkmanii]MBQ4938646.1 EAST1 family heat-stable enterotoxin [Citrobacter werkmanii]MBQ4951492.1 EAST1 family heat-stable enterotoxin [Citrobacter werkmanii]MBQ4967377.1 EAST1 family heat-stable enterotoxin [Citrobacter werkmanii]HBW0109027.1 EAST1 family heat-stable enterotoxin [Klebsiella aerogenes]